MVLSFDKEKMAPMKAVMALMIVADHLALFYGIARFRLFIEVGAPIVSLFFYISGYGLHKSYLTRGKKYLDGFFHRRIWKVVLPVLISLSLYYILLWNPSRDFWGEWRDLFMRGIPVLPFSWFAVAIIIFYAAFYLCYRFLPEWLKVPGLWVCIVLLMILSIIIGYDRCWWVSSLAFPTGALFASYESKLYALFNRRPTLYWLFLLSLFTVFILCYLTGRPFVWPVCYVCIPLIVALVVARLPIEKCNVRVVAFLAMISYEIYLCQGIAMQFLRGHYSVQNDALFVILVYALTIVLAWGVHLLSGLLSFSQNH